MCAHLTWNVSHLRVFFTSRILAYTFLEKARTASYYLCSAPCIMRSARPLRGRIEDVFKPLRGRIEDVFKLLKDGFFKEKIHRYTRKSCYRFVLLGVLLAGIIINKGFYSQELLQGLAESWVMEDPENLLMHYCKKSCLQTALHYKMLL